MDLNVHVNMHAYIPAYLNMQVAPRVAPLVHINVEVFRGSIPFLVPEVLGF